MKTLVIGLGKSGRAAIALLEKIGDTVTRFDDCQSTLSKVDFTVDRAVVSPGIPPDHPILTQLKERGIPVIGEMELGLKLTDQTCLGITGTNGKTSTTECVAHILREKGIKAHALGNNGTPLCHYMLNPDPNDVLILEISSAQLETLSTKGLDRALILNITPDHLDRYGTFEAYAKTKCHIKSCLKEGGELIVDAETKKKFEKYLEGANTRTFGKEGPIKALLAPFNLGEISDAEAGFSPLKHRLERVLTRDGVVFVNDSKATNVEATLHAIDRLKGPVHIILGGRDKGSDFSRLKEPFTGKVKSVFVYGEAGALIAKALEELKPIHQFATLKEAVERAASVAQAGDTVLLSPACTSFDAFDNFEKRGDAFREYVKSGNNL